MIIACDVKWSRVNGIGFSLTNPILSNFRISDSNIDYVYYDDYVFIINLDNLENILNDVNNEYYTVSIMNIINEFMNSEWYKQHIRNNKLKRLISDEI